MTAGAMAWRAYALTAAALVAFAANSLLCRLALGTQAINAYAFTAIRLACGALTLSLLALTRPTPQPDGPAARSAWGDGLWLIVYALPFSIAYRSLATGTGALLLFGAVQLTLVVWALRQGERPSLSEGAGFFGAGVGLVYLVFPGLTAPDPWGAGCMVLAGIGWGLYTVAGKRGGDPVVRNGRSFVRATALMIPVVLATARDMSPSFTGVGLAALSGVVTSGLGYATWYAALRYLSATRAALVQLGVPILAAALGIAILDEPLTMRLLGASALVLGSLAFATRSRAAR